MAEKNKEINTKIVEHEVRLSLTEQALKDSREAQNKILKNTEQIIAKQQEMAKTLSLLEASHKNQWREITDLKEQIDLKASQKDFESYKTATDAKITAMQRWLDARIKWLIGAFFALVGAVTGLLAVFK